MSVTAAPAATLLPGFRDPVHDSQRCFRALLDAMARPGTLVSLPAPQALPDGWTPALTALALTLFDQETAVWLDSAAASAAAHLRFHCGCPLAERPERATFAVIAAPASMPPLHAFPIGDPQYPDRSATLILALPSLAGGPALRLTGPGIKGEAMAAPQGLPPKFVHQWADNHALYPSGIDVILTAGDRAMGLPRGVAIEEA